MVCKYTKIKYAHIPSKRVTVIGIESGPLSEILDQYELDEIPEDLSRSISKKFDSVACRGKGCEEYSRCKEVALHEFGKIIDGIGQTRKVFKY